VLCGLCLEKEEREEKSYVVHAGSNSKPLYINYFNLTQKSYYITYRRTINVRYPMGKCP
jgi:hypothetical protein